MSHVRQQIRDAAIVALTGLATTGARVFGSRLRALVDADLPALLVNTEEETIERDLIDEPQWLNRTLTLIVRGVAKQTADLDDKLDTIAAEVETVLGGAAPLGALADIVGLESIETRLDDQLDKPVGVIELKYRINYTTASNAPSIAL